jgi:hypothetical protein
MDLMGLNDFDVSFKMLKTTEKLLTGDGVDQGSEIGRALSLLAPENRRRLLSLTFNNIGCYYKR